MNTSLLQLNKKDNKGFVILFSILVSSLILLISAGIFSVVQKEVVLSSSARESQRAFYAADSGLECALYSDLIGVGTPIQTPFSANGLGGGTIECGGDSIDIDPVSNYASNSAAEYDIAYSIEYYNALDGSATDNNSCAYVLIEKSSSGTIETGVVISTRITSVGFNICDDLDGDGKINDPDFDDPTLLERRLSISYSR